MPTPSDKPGKYDPNTIRHAAPPPGTHSEISIGDGEVMDAVTAHLESHVGKVAIVFHEIVSPLIHLDVHRVDPSAGRAFTTLCTTGCAERAMTPPPSVDPKWSYAELLCVLPPDWRLDEASLQDERWYFPIRWLKTFARLPHTYSSWICYGHTLPNGDPPEPFAPGVGFCSVALLLPYPFDPGFAALELPGRTIHFWMMVPLFREELQFKLSNGMEALSQRLEAVVAKVGWHGLFDPRRPNACARKKLFGLF